MVDSTWRRPVVMKIFYRLAGGAVVLAGAYLLKDFYSRAGSAELGWIIGPTAWLAGLLSDLSFTNEPGYGWVDSEHEVVIAPVCAGVNFLIISFCMSAFQVLRRITSLTALLTGIVIAGTASYLLTVIANAVRIVLSVSLYGLDIYTGWLTPETAHRVAGTAVYYLLLCLFSLTISRLWAAPGTDRRPHPGPGRHALLLIPLFWYLLFAIIIPLANNSYSTDPGLFTRHAVTVAIVTLALTVAVHKVRR